MVWDDGLKDHRSKQQLCCHKERGLARESRGKQRRRTDSPLEKGPWRNRVRADSADWPPRMGLRL